MRSPRFRAQPRLAVFATFLALAACSSAPRSFDEAFPEPETLLTTPDPEAAQAALRTVVIPDTDAHRERLLTALRSREQVTGSRLALLAAAMTGARHRVSTHDGETVFWPARGSGSHAGPTDELLRLGLPKLSSVSRREFGQLIGHTHGDDVLRAYCDRFLAGLDDGSQDALDEILAGMRGSPATAPFLAGVLAPSGRLDGPRGFATFARLVFDDDRVALLGALVARSMPLDGERLLTALRAFTFDEGRERAFALLAPRLDSLTPEQTGAAVATFTFDSGKEAAFAAISSQPSLRLSDEHLLAMARLCLFDSGKLQCLQQLAPRVAGPANGEVAVRLLELFTFDSDRRGAVATMAHHWRGLDAATKQRLLATFTFDRERQRAEALL